MNIYLEILSVVVLIIIILVVVFIKNKHHSHTNSGDGDAYAASLRDEKQRSNIILDSIEDGVILIGKDGTIQMFNKGASKVSGWPDQEAKNLNYKSVLRLINEKGEPYTEEKDPVLKTFNSQESVRDNNAFLVTHNDKQLPVWISVTPLINQKHQTSGVVAIFRDMTQERQEEKQRSEFISTASHEMRTPVAAIEGYLALALNEKVSSIDSRARNYLEKAHESTEHLGKLFQDLLTSAKAEDGRLTSHPNLMELGTYIEKLVNDLRFAADKKGLVLEYKLGTPNTIDATSTIPAGQKIIRPLYYVLADSDRMREVITNLFDNAVKYTDTGKITIGLTGDDQVAQIYIQDTGVGIPSEDIPHLFQKFYRVDNTATRTIGGTGLGLYICRKIIELYQGRIWVESTIGKGSTFFINLPRLSNDRAEIEKKKEISQNNSISTITPLGTGMLQ